MFSAKFNTILMYKKINVKFNLLSSHTPAAKLRSVLIWVFFFFFFFKWKKKGHHHQGSCVLDKKEMFNYLTHMFLHGNNCEWKWSKKKIKNVYAIVFSLLETESETRKTKMIPVQLEHKKINHKRNYHRVWEHLALMSYNHVLHRFFFEIMDKIRYL